MLRRPSEGPSEGDSGAISAAHGGSKNTTLAALKDELFHLETERLQGHVTEAEYIEHKAALERVLRRVLQRGAGGSSAPATPSSPAGDGQPTTLSADLSARSGLS